MYAVHAFNKILRVCLVHARHLRDPPPGCSCFVLPLFVTLRWRGDPHVEVDGLRLKIILQHGVAALAAQTALLVATIEKREEGR